MFDIKEMATRRPIQVFMLSDFLDPMEQLPILS
jgi:hypothetical protein